MRWLPFLGVFLGAASQGLRWIFGTRTATSHERAQRL